MTSSPPGLAKLTPLAVLCLALLCLATPASADTPYYLWSDTICLQNYTREYCNAVRHWTPRLLWRTATMTDTRAQELAAMAPRMEAHVEAAFAKRIEAALTEAKRQGAEETAKRVLDAIGNPSDWPGAIYREVAEEILDNVGRALYPDGGDDASARERP